jgi:hypothetical protein
MPLLTLLRTVKWKHVIGELLLIVVGVLLALAVNNWNTTRQTRREELSLLKQLRASLAIDLANLRTTAEGFTRGSFGWSRCVPICRGKGRTRIR